MTARPPADNPVILASAGAGKTYRLTARYIDLLDRGVEPGAILATTFTRKAAGEILRRVMTWLGAAAGDKDEAAALAAAIGRDLAAARAGALLAAFCRELHRVNIATMDSFFNRIARVFGLESGLGPGWRPVEENGPEDAAVRDAAVADVIARTDPDDLLRMVSELQGEAGGRGVYEKLRGYVETAWALRREAPAAAWGLPGGAAGPQKAAATAAADALRDGLAALVPVTKAGAPNKRWLGAVTRCLDDFAAGRWQDVVCGGFVQKILTGEDTYYRAPVGDELKAALRPVIACAVGQVRRSIDARARAARTLAERFGAAYEALKAARGVCCFGDITRLIADRRITAAPETLARRMDLALDHVLLDEFQDTDPAQWEAVGPLAERALAGAGTLFAVGDVKQAIYGWRGGSPDILAGLAADGRTTTESLPMSWRSSPVVIDLVNRVFGAIADNPALADAEKTPGVADWAAGFEQHTTAREDLPGYAALIPVDENDGDDDDPDAPRRPEIEKAADIAAEISAASGATVGILFRTNEPVPAMIAALRARGVPASRETGNPLTDAPAVAAAVAGLHLADHPGDTAARYRVAGSPLGPAVGLAPGDGPAAAAAAAARIRRGLQEEGFAPTLRAWRDRVADDCSARDLLRFEQLIETAAGHDEGAGIRAAEFAAVVRGRNVEDPSAARVRVMTVHKAKGLEFDAVILPELARQFNAVRPDFLTLRTDDRAGVARVVPYVDTKTANIDEQLREMCAQHRRENVAGELCALYVALTRAVNAVYMICRRPRENKDGSIGIRRSFAGILFGALGAGDIGGETLWESDGPLSDPRWYARRAREAGPGLKTIDVVLRAGAGERGRNLPRAAPSSLAAAGRTLGGALRIEPPAGLARGSLFHEWFELIEWIEDGLPDEAALRGAAAAARVSAGALEESIGAFRKMCGKEELRRLLSRGAYAPLADLEVCREYPFAVFYAGSLLNGKIDRIVFGKAGGALKRVDIIDYKTDAVGGPADIDRLVEQYRPQVEAYRSAIGRQPGTAAAETTVRLVFLNAPGEMVIGVGPR